MFRSCSEECAKTILLKARPQVCLQKESLIEPGALCTELYILMTGALQVTLPHDDADPAREATITKGMESRNTTKKGLKGERMRILEKQGQLLGVSDPFQRPTPFPFHVTGVCTSSRNHDTLRTLCGPCCFGLL